MNERDQGTYTYGPEYFAELDDQARQPSDPLAQVIFGVLEMIKKGDLDKWLHRLRGAINVRSQTDAYQEHIVAEGRRS